MRRTLVLGDEAARHPFRQSLPPHLRGSEAQPEGPIRGLAARLAEVRRRTDRRKLASAPNFRSLLVAYSASFVAMSVFLA